MGKIIKDVSAKPDDPMFTGVTFISAIMRPELSTEEKPMKTKKEKGKKASKLSKKSQQQGSGIDEVKGRHFDAPRLLAQVRS